MSPPPPAPLLVPALPLPQHSRKQRLPSFCPQFAPLLVHVHLHDTLGVGSHRTAREMAKIFSRLIVFKIESARRRVCVAGRRQMSSRSTRRVHALRHVLRAASRHVLPGSAWLGILVGNTYTRYAFKIMYRAQRAHISIFSLHLVASLDRLGGS